MGNTTSFIGLLSPYLFRLNITYRIFLRNFPLLSSFFILLFVYSSIASFLDKIKFIFRRIIFFVFFFYFFFLTIFPPYAFSILPTYHKSSIFHRITSSLFYFLFPSEIANFPCSKDSSLLLSITGVINSIG